MSAIYATDPATNERVTLSELSRRYGIHVGTQSRRYAAGIRGRTLVKAFNNVAAAEEQHAKTRAAAERKQAVITASGRGLMRPLNHIAGVSKMVGGSQ